jgi:hypothetical protein
MDEKFKDILSNLSSEVDQETLLKYLQGQLSEEEKNAVEKKMMANDFNNDALEGLEEIKNKERLSFLVENLNYDLKKKLKIKKQRKDRLRLKDQPWLYIAILITLLLIILSYFVIHRTMQQS